jgi:hypothetical protein
MIVEVLPQSAGKIRDSVHSLRDRKLFFDFAAAADVPNDYDGTKQNSVGLILKAFDLNDLF